MKRNTIISLVVIAFSAVIIWSIIQVVTPRATLLMSVAPNKVTVEINGKTKQVESGDKISVAPGDISISISRSDFETYTENINVENGKEFEVLVALNPLTDDARRLLNTENSQTIIQRIANKKMEQGADELVAKYPIVSALPIKDKFFTITICNSHKEPNDASKIAICVYLYNSEAKKSAINTVTLKGYNLNDYEHYFVDSEYNQGEVLHNHLDDD